MKHTFINSNDKTYRFALDTGSNLDVVFGSYGFKYASCEFYHTEDQDDYTMTQLFVKHDGTIKRISDIVQFCADDYEVFMTDCGNEFSRYIDDVRFEYNRGRL